MKIKVKDILPNPFRDINECPIRRETVESLKSKIKKNRFYLGLPGREIGKKIELAFGHHRLEALKELYGNDYEVKMDINDMDDAEMLRAMILENDSDFKKQNLEVNMHDVKQAKTWLDSKEGEKYLVGIIFKNYPNEKKRNENIKKNKDRYIKEGVGYSILSNFMDWPKTRVQETLKTLWAIGELIEGHRIGTKPKKKAKKIIERKDLKKLPSQSHAVNTIREIEKVEKETDEEISPEIKKEIINEVAKGPKGDVKGIVRSVVTKSRKPKKEKEDPILKELEKSFINLEKKISPLTGSIRNINKELDDLNTDQITGLTALVITDKLADLLFSIKELLTYFGYDFNKLQLEHKGG